VQIIRMEEILADRDALKRDLDLAKKEIEDLRKERNYLGNEIADEREHTYKVVVHFKEKISKVRTCN